MASHAGSDIDDFTVSHRRRAPKPTYDVRSTCLATAASIAALLAVFAVLIFI